ncbi:MAG: isoprenoid biosynthesis glyoxalase ElbB [Deltaproteobacteria bacterium]|nr:isoprenoid biosynthesis glyoxalase ElbB [Deltaproteobacteria bacterium]
MSDSKTIAVVLSGCGVYDGAEIHEAVLTLLALDRAGVTTQIYAPDIPQAHVVNHLTGEVAEGETRNVLVESARIARGEIKALSELSASDANALVFPGGFGGAKNLSTFAFDGPAMSVNAEVTRVVSEFRASEKPIGFICITPAFAAKLIPGVKITLGCEGDAPAAARQLGAEHVETSVDQIVIDEQHNVVSTAAYMLGPWIAAVAAGIDALVAEVLRRS